MSKEHTTQSGRYLCAVCKVDLGWDAPSGVCSAACLYKGQGFAVPPLAANPDLAPLAQASPGATPVPVRLSDLIWIEQRVAYARQVLQAKPNDCDSCNGLGDCWDCDGSGRSEDNHDETGQCCACEGSGVCQDCGGEGTLSQNPLD